MPQRFLRPGIRTSPRWNAVSHRTARLYVAILTLVDDYGRYDGRPAVLWADAFAVWNDQNPQFSVTPQETAADCTQLAAEKLVEFYEVEGRIYLQVVQWQETARNKSKWPEPLSRERLPMAADSCRNLPSSPSPSSSSSSSVLALDVPAAPKKNLGKGTREEIVLWCLNGGLPESDAEYLWGHWEGNGWTNNGKPIKNWRQTISSWKAANYLPSQKTSASKPKSYV